MTTQPKVIIRYSISFKQKVVKDIEEGGLGLAETARRYGINGGQTIQNWIKQFGKNHLLNKVIRVEMKGEKDRTKQLEEEIKKLKLALADSLLAQRCLEVVIDEANKEYKTDLKKSFGDAASTNSTKSSK